MTISDILATTPIVQLTPAEELARSLAGWGQLVDLLSNMIETNNLVIGSLGGVIPGSVSDETDPALAYRYGRLSALSDVAKSVLSISGRVGA